MIEENPNYEDAETVVICACNTGNPDTKDGSECYAQQVADALGEGAKVMAPDDYYFLSEDPKGTNYIGGRKDDGTPDFNAPKGKMVTYTGRKKECNYD